ncbi:MAG: type III PLP-dependent enzyme [Rhodobacteraceae bacterium]|nr:type III PLP-dependent enzyme [Paracoccaceae bacterium]
MKSDTSVWKSPRDYLAARQPDSPVAFFCPRTLHQTAEEFLEGFPGLVTYAVKANPDPAVIANLHAAGLRAFDVASPVEIDLVRAMATTATLHYNNPVRSRAEIAYAVNAGVRSYSVDSFGEFDKLAELVPAEGTEMSVRLKLTVKGAAYDFGEKFGANAEKAVDLLKRASAAGYLTSMTFHPGTQCFDPQAWVSYMATCADVAKQAGVALHRLNVGGGFPSHRAGDAPALEPIFKAIEGGVKAHFGKNTPMLVCEPGRAMAAEAFTLVARVKGIGDNGAVYLNDGIYGGLTEFRDLDTLKRVNCLSSDGQPRFRKGTLRVVFGPTCDSLDKLPDGLNLPGDIAEGDYILFSGMGAYVHATCTRFNGYGDIRTVTVSGFAY